MVPENFQGSDKFMQISYKNGYVRGLPVENNIYMKKDED